MFSMLISARRTRVKLNDKQSSAELFRTTIAKLRNSSAATIKKHRPASTERLFLHALTS